MTKLSPARAAVVGLLAVLASAVPAQAGGCLRHLCHVKGCKDCEAERVTLPAREIEVVNERPRVIVREAAPTRAVRRTVDVGFAPIGAVYMPLALPPVPAVGVAALPGVATAGASRELEVESNPLEAAHRAELAALRSEHARAVLQATMEAHKRVLDRIGPGGTRAVSAECASPALDQKVAQLAAEIQKLNERVNSVEKLLIYHDNWIQGRAGPAPMGAPTRALPPSPGLPGAPAQPTPSGAPGGPPGVTPPPMVPPVPAGGSPGQ